eukprot:TCONS_00016358-protein
MDVQPKQEKAFEQEKSVTFLLSESDSISDHDMKRLESMAVSSNASTLTQEAVRNLNYLKNVFVKVCIKSLQSSQLGPWIHLIEVLNLLKPFSDFLLRSESITHYLVRLFDYCNQHEEINHLKIPQLLTDIFPNFDFDKVIISKSISSMNARDSMKSPMSPKTSNIIDKELKVNKEIYVKDSPDLFHLTHYDLQSRVYEPKSLSVGDLQRYLPKVVSDLTRLEATWSNSLGLTITSINTDIPDDEKTRSPSPTYTPPTTYPSMTPKKFTNKPKKVKPAIQKTGREVVESLVAACRRKDIQIWYLNVVPSVAYSPYNLITTSKSTLKKEHVVMSVFGVLHVRPNGESDLTPIGQWYMEAVCYDTIKNIPFYRNFTVMKCFNAWKRYRQYNQFLKLKKNLLTNQLLKIPSFPDTILNVQNLLLQSQQLSLLPLCKNGKLNLKDIGSLITNHLTNQRRYLHKLFMSLQYLLTKCHTDCVDYFNYCVAQLNSDVSDQESLAVVHKRKEKQMKNRKSADSDLKRFHSITKLINQMISSNLICKLSSEINVFIHRQVLNNSKGCFYCRLETHSSDVILSPSQDEMYAQIEKAFSAWLVELENRYLLVLSPEERELDSEVLVKEDETYHPTLQSLKDDLTNKEIETVHEQCSEKNSSVQTMRKNKINLRIKDDVLTSKLVEDSCKELKIEIAKAFTEGKNLLASFQWLDEILKFFASWNVNEFELKMWSAVSDVEKQIVTLKKWKENIIKMEDFHRTSNGVLYIDTSQVHIQLLPKLEKIFSEIISILTQRIFTETEKLFAELSEYIKELSKKYNGASQFALFFIYINNVKVKVPAIQETVDKLKSCFELIKHCYRQLTPEEESREEKMWLIYENFMFALQNGNNLVTAQVPSYIEQLNRQIAEGKKEANYLVTLATTGEFLDASNEPALILMKLKEHYGKFNEIFERIQTHVKCMETISGYQGDFKELLAGRKKINSRYESWKYLELSTQAIKEWNTTVFSKFQANVLKICQKIQTWFAAAKALKNELDEDDQVYKRWMDLVIDFNDKMKVLQKLANAVLKDHHWRDIFLLLGHTYNPNIQYRISDILSLNIVENAAKVYQICAAASSEYALQQCLQTLIKKWEKKNFKFRKQANTTNKNRSITNSYLLTGVDELICQLEDSLLTLDSMLVSPHISEVKEVISHWNSELQEIKEILDIWMVAQQQWMYMSQIFSFGSAQQNHPKEFTIFKEVNAIFKDLIDSTMGDSKVLHILEKKRGEKGWREYQGQRLKETLLSLIEKQTESSKAIDTSVEKVQEQCPRLYFWSQEELLSLITYSPNPASLITIVKNCFPSVTDLDFEMPSDVKVTDSIDVTLNLHLLQTVSVKGELDETLSLCQPIATNKSIEEWLTQFQSEITNSLRKDMAKCIQFKMKEYFNEPLNIEQWSKNNLHREYTIQSLVMFYNVLYTNFIRDVSDKKINETAVRERLKKDVKRLTDFLQKTKMWTFHNNTDTRFLMLVQTILLKAIHFRDYLNEDLPKKDSFDWFKMVQFHCDFADGDELYNRVWINFLGMRFDYGLEYLGPSDSLVLNPSSDRYIITALSALKQYQVACLYGTNGTSKTSTVAEIGKVLGRYTYTMLCTSNTTLRCLEKVLMGALRVGCLFHLDKIELLSQELLSTLGHLMESIHQHFLKTNKFEKNDTVTAALRNFTNLEMNDTTIKMNPMYGCLLTCDERLMEWKRVPDNLRRCMTPIGMKIPDYRYIFECWLTIYGFTTCQSLAEKLALLLKVSQYEVGLTASKVYSIIVTAAKQIHIDQGSDAKENVLLAKALVNSIRLHVSSQQSASVGRQVQTIFSLSKDAFGPTSSQSHNALLVDAIKEQIKADQLEPKAELITKVLELQSLLCTNQAVIIYGSCATGKSTCYQTLSRALCQFHSPWSLQADTLESLKNENFARVNLKVVYPNALSQGEIYGCYDQSTQTWNDGLVVKLLRQFSLWKDVERSQTFDHTGQDHICSDIQQWLVMDGSVQSSSNWTYEMEGLLDTFKVVVMQNRKRLKTTRTSKLLFEMESLAHCTPSLLSRSSWLYFPELQTVTWECVYYSWSKMMHSKYAIPIHYFEELKTALVYTLEPTIKYMDQELSLAYHTKNKHDGGDLSCNIECGYILQILSALLHHWINKDPNLSPLLSLNPSNKEFVTKFLCNALALSFGYGLSPLVDRESIPKLDLFIRQVFSTCPPCSVIFPTSFNDCYFDGVTGEMKLWNEQKAQSTIPMASSSFVVTREIQQCYTLTDMLLSCQKNCMLIGDVATGKSQFVKHLLTFKHHINRIQISNAMTVTRLQSILMEKVSELRNKHMTKLKLKQMTTSSFHSSKKMDSYLMFLDDLSSGCLTKDDSGDGGGDVVEQPLYELTRQLVVEGGCYNMKGNNFHLLPNLQLLITHTPTGTQPSSLNMRLLRNFCLINYVNLSHKDWASIFQRPCQAWVDDFYWVPWKHALTKVTVNFLLRVHSKISTIFTQSISPTYIFSHHLLAKVVKRITSFRNAGDKESMQALSKIDFDYYFACDHEFVGKSISEQLIAPTKPFKEQVHLLIQSTSKIFDVICKELSMVYQSRLEDWNEKTNFHSVLHDELQETLRMNSNSKGKESTSETPLPIKFTELLIKEMNSKTTSITNHQQPLQTTFHFDATEPITFRLQPRVRFKKGLTKIASSMEGCSSFVLDDVTLDHAHNLYSALQTANGHCLLISDKSHGRRKMINIVSKLMRVEVFQVPPPNSTDSITIENTFNVIKDACNAAGLNGKPVILSIQGNMSDEVDQCLSALLCDGFCPGFYEPSEIALVITQHLPGGHLNNVRKINNISQLVERFFQRVRNNLQIVVGIKRSEMCDFLTRFPTILHKFHLVDFYGNNDAHFWSAFSTRWLIENMTGEDIDAPNLSELIGTVHHVTKQQLNETCGAEADRYISPLKLMECLQIFKKLFHSIREVSQKRSAYLNKAMAKVFQAKEDIRKSQDEIDRLQPLLETARSIAEDAEKVMKSAQESYLTVKKSCEDQYTEIERLKIPCEQLRKETNQDFEQLSPLFQAALEALNMLSKGDIVEMKSYPAPPEGVKLVAILLCVLFDVPESYKEAILLLRSDNFIQRLQFLDKDNISDSAYRKLCKFVNDPETQPTVVASKSRAAEQLCLWLRGIHSYCTIYRQLQPKKQSLKEAELKIAKAESKLCEMKLRTSDLRDLLEKEIVNYKGKMKIVKGLEKKQQISKDALKYIETLLNTMSPFTDHWESEVQTIHETQENLSTNALTLAISSIYLGMVPSNEQQNLKTKWRQELSKDSIDFLDDKSIRTLLETYLTSEREQYKWTKIVDPVDQTLSTTLLLSRMCMNYGSRCWPLFLDPFDHSEDWVKMMERSYEEQENVKRIMYDDTNERVMVVYGDDVNLENKLLKAVQSGLIMLIKRIECAADSALLSTLLTRGSIQNGSLTVKGEQITCSPNFKLYMSTNLSMEGFLQEELENPLHKTIIYQLQPDFIGLQQHALKLIILSESNELEAGFHRFRNDIYYLAREKESTNKQVLSKIANMEGSFLEDKKLFENMGFEREHLWLVQERIFESENLLNNIKATRQEYLPIATHVAKIYFILSKLKSVHPSYRFDFNVITESLTRALQQNVSVMSNGIDSAAHAEDVCRSFTKAVNESISCALFAEHNYLFLILTILEKSSSLMDDLLNVIITSNTGPKNKEEDNEGGNTESKLDWITDEAWNNLKSLCKLKPFKELLESLQTRSEEWKEYFKATPSLMCPPYLLPDLSMFEVSLLWLAYDKKEMAETFSKMILCYLGPDFLHESAFEFNNQSIDRKCWCHLIVVPDNENPIVKDPTIAIREMAQKCKITDIKIISMDNTRVFDSVLKTFDEMSIKKTWLILQNCHLIGKWPKQILRRIQKLQSEKGDNSHLWLVTRDTEVWRLPESLLRHCKTIGWSPFKKNGKEINQLIPKDTNGSFGIDIQEEIFRNYRNFYSLKYKISCRELDAMRFFQSSINEDNNKDLVFKSQFTNNFDEEMFLLKKNVEKAASKNSAKTYTKMLSKYFKHGNSKPIDIYRTNIDSLIKSMKDLIDKRIRKPHRLTRHHLFDALCQESHQIERFANIALFDLNRISKTLSSDLQMSIKLRLICQALYKDLTPDSWIEHADGTTSTTSLSDRLKHYGKQLKHFEHVLVQSRETVFDLSLYTNVLGLVNTLKLESIEREEPWVDNWWLEIPEDLSPLQTPTQSIVLQNTQLQIEPWKRNLHLPYVLLKTIKEMKMFSGSFSIPIFDGFGNRITSLHVRHKHAERYNLNKDTILRLQKYSFIENELL